MKPILIIGIGCLCLCATLDSCKHEIITPAPAPPGDTVGVITENCSADTAYFQNEIFPLINSTCAKAGCHDAISHKDDVILTSYANIMKYVKAGNAAESKLYKAIVASGSDRMPQQPDAPWTATQISRLSTWIQQGARNNNCNACDSSDFKFNSAIQPQIQTYCQGCHSGTAPGGGLVLTTHANIRSAAITGKLYGSVTWSTGFSAMPKGQKLSDCRIKQIKKWIDAGCPNN